MVGRMPRLRTSFDSVVLAAVAHEVFAYRGTRIVRVVQPSPVEVALELRGANRRGTLLCSIDPRWARVHLGTPSATGALSGFGQLLRARLEGAKLIDITQPPFERTLTLGVESVTGVMTLAVEIMGRHSNLILVHDGIIVGSLKVVSRAKSSVREVLPGRPYSLPPRDRPTPADLSPETLTTLLSASAEPIAKRLSSALLGISPSMATELVVRSTLDPAAPANSSPQASRQLWPHLQELVERVRAGTYAPTLYFEGSVPVGYTPFPFVHLARLRAVSVPGMSEAVERVMGHVSASSRLDDERTQLQQTVGAARARVERTLRELRESLAEVEHAQTLKEYGELLLAYAASVPSGARQVVLPGYESTPVTIPLEPTLSAVENAQRLFKRYGKLKTAKATVEQRVHAVEPEAAYLGAVQLHIDQAESPEDLFDLRRELIEGGYLRRARTSSRPSSAARMRTVHLQDGSTIHIGRSNLENDYLTFKVAAPDDLWFHARGVPGAHVVLRKGGGKAAGADPIGQAAAIAAYFSRARESTRVAVDYTERRHVRKPRGAKPGAVVYTHERTVHVVPTAPEAIDDQRT